jgi:HEPN domain-containing protein
MKPPEAALRQLVRQWIDKATADFEAAEQLSTRGGRFREIVAFHCQQAVEKYLKASWFSGKSSSRKRMTSLSCWTGSLRWTSRPRSR